MADTLLLDTKTWDLCVDTSGNIAVASGTYALSQDASSAVRLFQGEWVFDTTIGIPYFQQVLGKNPPIDLIRRHQRDAALTVPGANSVAVYYSSITDGQLAGQVQVTGANGAVSTAGF